MAQDLERLIVSLETSMKKYERQMAQTQRQTDQKLRQIENRYAEAERKVSNFGDVSAKAFRRSIAALSVGLIAREAQKLADIATDLQSRVNLAATASGGSGVETMERLNEVARRTYSSIELTTEAYLRNSTALRELGYNTRQQLDFTEALNNALVVSGAKAQRAESVQNALAKAMALGELRGDNLNTVIQTGGRVAEALAAGLGVTTNELRKLGQEGKLTSDVVFRALTSQMQDLRTEAEAMPATVGDAMTLLRNAFIRYVSQVNEATSATEKMAGFIIYAADHLETFGTVATVAAFAIGGNLAGRALIAAIPAMSAFAASTVASTAALAGLARGSAAASAQVFILQGAMVRLRAAMMFLGGPWAIVIGGIATALGLLYLQSRRAADEAREKQERWAQSLTDVNDRLERTREYADRAAGRTRDFANQADTGAPKVRAFAGAVGDLAQSLYDLAFARREGEMQGLISDIARLNREIAEIEADRNARVSRARPEILDNPFMAGFETNLAAQIEAEANAEIEKRQQLLENLKGTYRELGDLALEAFSRPEDTPAPDEDAAKKAADIARLRERLALENQLALAKAQNDTATVRALEDQLDILRLIEQFERAEVGNAREKAEAQVAALRAAEDAASAREAEKAFSDALLSVEQDIRQEKVRQLEIERDLANLRGDETAVRNLERRLEIEREISRLRGEGVTLEEARARAGAADVTREAARAVGEAKRIADEFRDRVRQDFRKAFTDAFQVLREGGNIGDAARSIGLSIAEAFAQRAIESLADTAADLLFDTGKAVTTAQAQGVILQGALISGGAAAATAMGSAITGAGASAAAAMAAAISSANTGSGLLSIFGRAVGGPVSSGTPYLVGENGPELFVPNQSGVIRPDGIRGGGREHVTVRPNIIVNAQGAVSAAEVDRRVRVGVAESAPAIGQAVMDVLERRQRVRGR